MSVDQYRENALDCIRLASEVTLPDARAELLSMAQTWIKLADHAAQIRRGKKDAEPPQPTAK